MFHAGTPGAQFQPDGTSGRVSGPAPDHASYRSFASFRDPDGNGWLFQEITTGCPGASTPRDFVRLRKRSGERVSARRGRPRRAREAHRRQRDANWPDWYAAYMVAEQAGKELPQ